MCTGAAFAVYFCIFLRLCDNSSNAVKFIYAYQGAYRYDKWFASETDTAQNENNIEKTRIFHHES